MYHLACPTRDQYEEDPIQALESCFIGTKNLLDVALRCNARVVLATRSHLNEVSREQPQHASWDDRLRRKRKRSTEAPQLSKPAAKRRRTQKMAVRSTGTSFYEEGNRLAEMLCSAYEQHFGLEVRVAGVPEARQQSSKHKDGDGRVLEVIAPADETPVDSVDTTLVDNNTKDDVLRGLVDLMEAPGPGKAVSNEARQGPGAVS
jgi:UDP-glucuronate decarboxylase